jgi:hypothetical protein
MRKSCASCGTEFEAKRAAAKYCGDRCRQRVHRRPDQAKTAELLPVPPEPKSRADDSAPGPSLYDLGPVTLATLAELEDAARASSSAGQAALALAQRIDRGYAETGSAFASLVRQHGVTLAEAVRGAAKAADPLDELRARRERKRDTG